MEDLAYRRMLDAYYLREGALPSDPGEVARLIRLRKSMPEVKAVLEEFFKLTDAGWIHARCDEEILRMQDKQAKARASAAASVNARRAKAFQPDGERSTSAQQSVNVRSTDVELPTPTPTPTPTPKEEPSGSLLAAKRRKQLPLDFSPSPAGMQFAQERGLDMATELQKFTDFHMAKGSVMLDWQAAWRTWASNAKTFSRSSPVANKQVAIEQRNKSVLGDWLAMEAVNA